MPCYKKRRKVVGLRRQKKVNEWGFFIFELFEITNIFDQVLFTQFKTYNLCSRKFFIYLLDSPS